MGQHVWLAFAWMLGVTTIAAAQEKLKLPDGAVARIGVHRLRVPGTISDCTFTPDQRTLVVVYAEKNAKRPNVVLFDVATGLERKRLNIRGAKHVAIARHKSLMAVDTDTGFEVWDLAAEKRLQQWEYPECVDAATALAISPDGAQVVAAAGLLLRWNTETGEELAPWRPRPSPFSIHTLEFSDDGCKLLIAETYSRRNEARWYFDVPVFQGELFDRLNWYLLPVSTMAGPRTRLLHTTAWAVGSHWVFRRAAPIAAVWDAKTGTRLTEFSNESGMCAMSPDGTMVALSVSSAYSRTRTHIIRLDREWTHLGTIDRYLSVVFTPDSKQLILDGKLVWDIAARKAVREFDMLDAYFVRLSHNGKLLAMVKSDNDADAKYRDYRYPVHSLDYFPERNEFVQLVDVATGKLKRHATGYSDAVGGLAYSPDGRTLASFSRDTLFIHDARTGAEQRRWLAHKKDIAQIAFSPDGKTLASASLDTTIGLWDPATGKELRRLAYGNQSETSCAFTADGKMLISVTDSGVVRRWDVAAGKHVESTQPRAMVSPTVSATGEYIVYFEIERETGGMRLQWLRARPGKSRALADPPLNFGQRSGSESLAFSADGKLLAASGSVQAGDNASVQTVCVWESATQREVVRYRGDDPSPTKLLAVSPDGRLLAHGGSPPPKEQKLVSADGVWKYYFPAAASEYAVILRDLASVQGSTKDDDRTIPLITGHLGRITCLAFSPDGKFLATGGSDQIVYIWRVEHFFKRPALPDVKGNVAELWSFLADPDPGKAYRAIAQLECKPKETLTLLRKQLRPAARGRQSHRPTRAWVSEHELRDSTASGDGAGKDRRTSRAAPARRAQEAGQSRNETAPRNAAGKNRPPAGGCEPPARLSHSDAAGTNRHCGSAATAGGTFARGAGGVADGGGAGFVATHFEKSNALIR